MVDRDGHGAATVASSTALFDRSQQGDTGLQRSDSSETRVLLALLSYALLIAAYFVARSWGLWSENDTAQLATGIRAVVDGGALAPRDQPFYPHGFGYAAVSSAVLAFTGLDLSALLRVVYPFTSAFLIIPAWLLYRELTGSRRAATL